MGEKQNQLFNLNASLRVNFRGSRVTSDAGLILVRELDERLGFAELDHQSDTSEIRRNQDVEVKDAFLKAIEKR